MYPRNLRRWLTWATAATLLLFLVVFVLLAHNQTHHRSGRSTADWYTSPLIEERFEWPAVYSKRLREIREVKAGVWMIVYSRTRPQAVGRPQPLVELEQGTEVPVSMATEEGRPTRVNTPGQLKKSKRVRKRRVPPTKQIDFIPKDFSSQLSYLTFPLLQFTKSSVLQSDWVALLQSYLSGLKSNKVSVVTANVEDSLAVINWLISAYIVAHTPPENVLVVSLSKELHHFLERKEIPVIYVDPNSILNNKTSMNISAVSEQHIVHLTVIRLVNHWGFHVVWYNPNTVVLHNPQSLFDKYPYAHLIGSEGHEPNTLFSIWGRTLSTQGVLLMKSSYEMEIFWETLANISRYPFTEEGLVNLALDSLGVEWSLYNDDLQGKCNTSGVKAVILSERMICHYTCDMRQKNRYYIWHNDQPDRDENVRLWFLQEDWTRLSELTGIEWLNGISENTGT